MTEDVQDVSLDQDIVYAIAASPAFLGDGICFAAQRSGLYRSDDGGETWHFALASLDLESPLPAMSVEVSPDFASDQSVFVGVPGGILRSVDGGETWHVVILRSPPPSVSTLATSPNFARDGVVFAGTIEDGVFRSGDRGKSWSAWNFRLLDLSVLCMDVSADFANDETLFIGAESGIFRSRNGGRAWEEGGFSTDLAPVLSLALSPNYARDETLFAGTETHGLFRSEDGGKAWVPLGEDEVAGEAVNTILLSPDYPDRPHILVALSTSLLVSRDDGETWSESRTNPAFSRGIIAVEAPRGLEDDDPLIVGLVGGDVLRL